MAFILDAIWLLQDREDEVAKRILAEWDRNRNTNTTQVWPVIPASYYLEQHELLKTKQVDPEMVKVFENLVVDAYLRLYVNTVIMGHDQLRPYDYAKEHLPYEMSYREFEDWLEGYEDWASDDRGHWFISDYGLQKMGSWIVNLVQEEEDANYKLYCIDQVLSVTHQRSDLPRWFIEGGSNTLDILGGL